MKRNDIGSTDVIRIVENGGLNKERKGKNKNNGLSIRLGLPQCVGLWEGPSVRSVGLVLFDRYKRMCNDLYSAVCH